MAISFPRKRSVRAKTWRGAHKMLEIIKPRSERSIDQLLVVGRGAESSQTGVKNAISHPAHLDGYGILQIAEVSHSVGGERFVKTPVVGFLENPTTVPVHARVARVHPMT